VIPLSVVAGSRVAGRSRNATHQPDLDARPLITAPHERFQKKRTTADNRQPTTDNTPGAQAPGVTPS